MADYAPLTVKEEIEVLHRMMADDRERLDQCIAFTADLAQMTEKLSGQQVEDMRRIAMLTALMTKHSTSVN